MSDYINAKSLPSILNGEIFKVIGKNGENNLSAQCLLCEKNGQKKKIISGTNGVTSNFRLHLKVIIFI